MKFRNTKTGEIREFDCTGINSALLSAQNRQRLYWVGKREEDGTYSKVQIEQPEDRGILLRDVLDSAFPYRQTETEKGYCLDANYWKTPGSPETFLEGGHARANRTMVAETVGVGHRNRREDDGQLYRRFETHNEQKSNALTTVQTDCMVAEPVLPTTINVNPSGKGMNGTAITCDRKSRCVTTNKGEGQKIIEPVRIANLGESGGQGQRVYSTDAKASAVRANGRQEMISEPVCMRYERTEEAKIVRKQYEAGEVRHGFHELSEMHPRTDGKTNTLSTVLKDNPICEPVRIGTIESAAKNADHDSQQYRVYSPEGKAVTLCGNGGGVGAKTGLYAVPTDGKSQPIYEVRNGLITIKDKRYPIKLTDGYYIIRKLTVSECCRLQTVPCIANRFLQFDFNNMEVSAEKCFVHQNNSVPVVVEKCHKLLKLAANAESVELTEFVLYAEEISSTSNPPTKEPAPLNVHINCEGLNNLIGYSEALLKNANIVGVNLSFQTAKKIGSFAQSIVGMNMLLENFLRNGETVLPLNGKPFITLKNGKIRFIPSGREMAQLVKDVEADEKAVETIFKSIISEVLQDTQNYEQMLTTLSCYVISAIGGYIQKKTNRAISFSIEEPFFSVISNSQAYKCLGNGWTVDVIAHLLTATKNHPQECNPKGG